MNYQIYHFCEMTRMIQAQSASLAFFMETILKIYNWIKEFVIKHANNTYLSVKLYFVKKLSEIRTFFLNFFNFSGEVNDEREKMIKQEISFIDKMIKYLIISSTSAFIFTYMTSKI